MTKFRILIESPRPYFAEIPYALWGQVNYDSEGDCVQPTDQNWHEFELENRETGQRVFILGQNKEFDIESKDPEIAARTCIYLLERCSGRILVDDPQRQVGNWSFIEAQQRTARVRS